MWQKLQNITSDINLLRDSFQLSLEFCSVGVSGINKVISNRAEPSKQGCSPRWSIPATFKPICIELTFTWAAVGTHQMTPNVLLGTFTDFIWRNDYEANKTLKTNFLWELWILVEGQELPGVTGKFSRGVQNKAGQRLTEFFQKHWS